ncbi:MAG: hypothetical protein RL198_600 [Actinomycetota bacterium]
MLNPRLRSVLKAVYLLAVVGFLGIALASLDYSSLSSLALNPLFVVLATAVGIAARSNLVLIWHSVLRDFRPPKPINFWRLHQAYARAWMGRYIPGKVVWIGAKVAFAPQLGLSKSKVAAATLVESVLQVALQFFWGLLALLLVPVVLESGEIPLLALVAGFALAITAVSPPVLRALLNFALRLLRKNKLGSEDVPNYASLLKASLWALAATAVNGVSYFLLYLSMGQAASWDALILVVGATSLAGALGMLAIFAPSGIGVREAALVLFFLQFTSLEVAVLYAVYSRLWSIVADLLFLGFSEGAARVRAN